MDYVQCPRRFFYANVAAPRNPAIRDLAERRTAALIRHELVRGAIRRVLRSGNFEGKGLSELLGEVKDEMDLMVADPISAREQMSIVALW